MSIYTVFASQGHSVDRSSLQLVGRFNAANVPAQAQKLLDAIEKAEPELVFWSYGDEDMVVQAADDEESFGGSRFAVDVEELALETPAPKQSLDAFFEAVARSEAVEDYDLDKATLLKEARSRAKPAPVLKSFQSLWIKRGQGKIAVAKGCRRTLEVDKATEFDAPPELIDPADVDGVVFHPLPRALTDVHPIRGLRWWGTLKEAPKLEFYGRTKQDVKESVAIYRACVKYRAQP